MYLKDHVYKINTNILKSCNIKSDGMTDTKPKFLVNKTGVPEHSAPPRILSSPPRTKSILSCSCSDIPKIVSFESVSRRPI